MTMPRRFFPSLAAAFALVMLAGCGGGGGDGGSAPAPPPGNTVDPNAYSTDRNASLATPNELTAVTHHSLALAGGTVAYTATAGHLTALDPAQRPEASFFYVAYTADGAPAGTRPVTFLFNGGPGSASLWLHLGSWAPKRLVTGVPGTAQASPYPYVDNLESLIDTTDLVFVDAVGTGLSEAVAPNTNQTFWGVDADAQVTRDFVQRWLAVNGRAASPLFVYGESYGTVRAPVLALLLESAGVPVKGVVIQSSVVNYNSNCSIDLPQPPTVSCAGFLPTYAAVGAYYDLVVPPPADVASFIDGMVAYADATYDPQARAWLAAGSPPVAPAGADVNALAADTGLAAGWWNAHFDMDYGTYRHNLIPGTTLGVYDGRISAPVGSALDANDDPSNTLIAAGFQAGIDSALPGELAYSHPNSRYVTLSDAISHWNFSHGGNALPDVVPDIAATLALDPDVRFLSIGGLHDLITPFHQTELDLARLGAGAPVTSAFHPGGHMTYLDDGTRPLLKADLAAFYASALGAK